MKSARSDIGPTLDRPDPEVRFYLFHGADEAGSRGLGERLLKGLGAERHNLAAGELKADPALLPSEAAAISMFGGPRLLWIEPAGEEILPAVEALLEAPATEHPAVAIAGSLRKTSALLKLCDKHSSARAQVSYVPEGAKAGGLVLDLARIEGLRMSAAVAARIAALASNDRDVIRQELVKYALYLDASPEQPRQLDEDAIDALAADSTETDAGRIGDLALTGKLRSVGDELEQLGASGIDPIPVVRALQRRLLMLIPLRARVDSGQAPGAVTSGLFWKDRDMVAAILSSWTSERLAMLIDRVSRLERELLLGPTAGSSAVGEEMLRISRAVRR